MLPTQLPPAAAGQAVCSLVPCQRRPAGPVSATGPGSTLASSGAGLLTRGNESSGSGRTGGRPEPKTEVSGGGGGRGPRRRLGYSGDGAHEERGSGGLRLPWDRLFGCDALPHPPKRLARCCAEAITRTTLFVAQRC